MGMGMAIEVEVDQPRGLIIFRCTGKLSKAELQTALADYYQDNPSRKTLWDLRRASLNLTGPETEELARAVTALAKQCAPLRQGGKTASLVSTDLDFGLARMYQSYSAESPVDLGVFRTWAEAERWLDE
jgi:hypothetical protein